MAWFQVACAVAIALASPLMFVIVRHEVRFARLRALYEFDQLFDVSHLSPGKPGAEGDDADGPFGAAPTYEYVRARYTDDIEFPDDFKIDWIRTFDMGQKEFRDFIRSLRWWKLKSSWSILTASVPLALLTAYGLMALFSAAPETGPLSGLTPFPSAALIIGGANGDDAAVLARNVTMVGEAAFLGGYLFTLLLFLRALATFDLSPLTVMRGTLYFVVGIVAAVLLYRAFPDLPAQAIEASRAVASELDQAKTPAAGKPDAGNSGAARPAAALGVPTAASPAADPPRLTMASLPLPVAGGGGRSKATQTPAAAVRKPAAQGEKPVSRIWIALAFLLGFIPDLAVNTIIARVQKTFRIKTTDDRFINAVKSTPIELIDGIDVLTRFRLQESNIFEMQNLAVSNPVMLFIETPYGIYQVIDWVAQAQLCVSVGPERFIELQRRSIRTIFDLERAVLSAYSTSQLRRYVAGVLLSSIPPLEPGVALTGYGGLATAAGDPTTGNRTPADFAAYSAQLFSAKAVASDGLAASPDPDETIKHLVRTMVDDLHVCRLRQVWQRIMSRIDGVPPSSHSSDRLWDTEWLPPVPPTVPRPPYFGR